MPVLELVPVSLLELVPVSVLELVPVSVLEVVPVSVLEPELVLDPSLVLLPELPGPGSHRPSTSWQRASPQQDSSSKHQRVRSSISMQAWMHAP